MTVSKKVVTLPSKEEIMKRLRPVHDDAYMAERFLPLVAEKAAGKKLVAEGIVMMLSLAVADFVKSGYPPQMEGVLLLYMPMYIDALVDDKEVAKTAKNFFSEAMDK